MTEQSDDARFLDSLKPPMPDLADVGTTADEQLEQLAERIRICRNCDLAWNRTTAVPGEGNPEATIMLVGEAPGAAEDRTGRPFVGPSGKYLDSLLQSIGLDRTSVFIGNVNRCRPPENRDPTTAEVEACNPWLRAQIDIIKPKVICPLGRFALEALVGPRLKISKVHGQPIEQDGILFVPLYHPAAALHRQDLRETLVEDIQCLRRILEARGYWQG